MRDMSGRRQRDVHHLQKMKEYVTEIRPERQRLKKEKEEETLAYHRRVAEGRLHTRFSFCDPNYDKARGEVEGKVHDAVEAAMSSGGERTLLDVLQKEKAASQKKGGDKVGPAKKMSKGAYMMPDMDQISDSSDED